MHLYSVLLFIDVCVCVYADFQWVQGDVCEVQLMVYNPMPFELRVENMVSIQYLIYKIFDDVIKWNNIFYL